MNGDQQNQRTKTGNGVKRELFNFVAEKIAELNSVNDTIIATRGEDVISKKATNVDLMSPFYHEEADARIFIHARHALLMGNVQLLLNCTGVIRIAITSVGSLEQLDFTYCW